MANGRNYNDIVPKTRDYVEEGAKKKKNYDDIVPKTRNYVLEQWKKQQPKKNYNDIVPRTRSYIPKPPIDNPFYRNPIYDPSKPDEIIPAPLNPVSPEQAERIEQNLYNRDQEMLSDILDQPDTRTSPDDPEEHMERERRKAYAQVQATLASAYDLGQMNSDQRALLEEVVTDGLAEGYSLEEIMAEMERPDNAAYLGLVPSQPTPSTFDRLRKGAAEDALFRAEQDME